MMDENKEVEKQSKIVICNRETLSVTGISKVISSTDKLISVIINGKTMAIEGENLTVNELNLQTGILNASGKISSLKYTAEKQKDGLIKRIFG